MILVKNPHFFHSWSVLARIDQEKMFTDVLNKKKTTLPMMMTVMMMRIDCTLVFPPSCL